MALIFRLIRRRAWLVSAALVVSASPALALLFWNSRLSRIIDTVSGGGRISTELLIAALVSVVALCAFNMFSGSLSGLACEYLAHDLRVGYASKLSRLTPIEAEKLNAGERMSVLQNEIASATTYINSRMFQLVSDLINFIASFVWLMTLNPILTLSANLPMLPIMFYVVWSSGVIKTATESELAAKGRMNQYADTLLALFPVIKLYQAERMVTGGYDSALGDWEGHSLRAERTRAKLSSLNAVFASLPLLMLLGVGGYMTIKGGLTIGELYVFVNLSGNVSGILMNMPGRVADLRRFSAVMKRLAPNVDAEDI